MPVQNKNMIKRIILDNFVGEIFKHSDIIRLSGLSSTVVSSVTGPLTREEGIRIVGSEGKSRLFEIDKPENLKPYESEFELLERDIASLFEPSDKWTPHDLQAKISRSVSIRTIGGVLQPMIHRGIVVKVGAKRNGLGIYKIKEEGDISIRKYTERRPASPLTLSDKLKDAFNFKRPLHEILNN